MVVHKEAINERRGAISKELIFWGILGACVLGVMLLSRTIQRENGQGTKHPSVGKNLPEVSLEVLTGQGENLTLDALSGRVSLINFWGTWCPPCRVEFPHIVALDREFRDHANFKLVSISVPGGETSVDELRANTEKFLATRNADITTYVDAGQMTWRGVVDALDGQNGVPTTLILDGDGTIRGVWIGYAAGVEQDMQRLVSTLLSESS
jgi:cytochrome c biogenesis protein CcmG/thiol:disulfide interchange protein DsbE